MEVNELSNEAKVTETEKSPSSSSDLKEDEVTQKLDKKDEDLSESVNSDAPAKTPDSNLASSDIDDDSSKLVEGDNSEKSNPVENEVEENHLEDNESEDKSPVNNENKIEENLKNDEETLLKVNKDDETSINGKNTEILSEDLAKEPSEDIKCTELPLEDSENTEVLKDEKSPENLMEVEEDNEVSVEVEKDKNIVLEKNKEVLMEFDSNDDVSENIAKNDESLMKDKKTSGVSVKVDKNEESLMEVETCVSVNIEKNNEISMEVDKNTDILTENENSMDIEKSKDNLIELVKDEKVLENEEKTEKNSTEIVENKEISLSVKENRETSIDVEKNNEISLEIEENKEISLEIEENKEILLKIEENKEILLKIEENKEIKADVAIKEEITIEDEKNEDVSVKTEMKKEISVEAENDKTKEVEKISVEVENDKTEKVEEISLNTGENKVISINVGSKEISIETNESEELSVNAEKAEEISVNVQKTEEISIDPMKNEEINVKTGETKEIMKDIEQNKAISIEVDSNEKVPLEVQKTSEVVLEVDMIESPADIDDDDDDDGIEIIDDSKVSNDTVKSIKAKDKTVHKNIDENKNLTEATDNKGTAAVVISKETLASNENTDPVNILNDKKTPMIICDTEDPCMTVNHIDTSMEVDENPQIARLVIKGFEESENENENYIRMTVEEINDYVKEKVNIYMNDPSSNPLTVAKRRIAELVEQIEEKKVEVAKLQKAFESLNKDHVKFLRHTGSMPKVPTKTVGVGIDLEWLPETVSGLFQNSTKLQTPNGAPAPIKPKQPSGPIECIDLTDESDIPEPPPKPKPAIPDPKNVIITNSPAVSSLAGGPRATMHPAPLPVSTSISTLSASEIPPKPKLKISVDKNGIVLQWDMPVQAKKIKITGYEIYGYQEKPSGLVSSALWKRIGIVNPMPLPMSCTLTQFVEGFKYHFSIRGVSNAVLGHFSDPASIMFIPKSS